MYVTLPAYRPFHWIAPRLPPTPGLSGPSRPRQRRRTGPGPWPGQGGGGQGGEGGQGEDNGAVDAPADFRIFECDEFPIPNFGTKMGEFQLELIKYKKGIEHGNK
jgi:hypothetical protein